MGYCLQGRRHLSRSRNVHHPGRHPGCSQIRRYQHKISGPLLDRIDIRLQLQKERFALSGKREKGEASTRVAKRVADAQKLAINRAAKVNARLSPEETRAYCWPEKNAIKLLEHAALKGGLSRRACNRIMRVARTCADLATNDAVTKQHMAEALALHGLGYRESE